MCANTRPRFWRGSIPLQCRVMARGLPTESTFSNAGSVPDECLTPARSASDLERVAPSRLTYHNTVGTTLTSDVTTIGFIGSGNIGGTVARLAVAVGYDVVLSNSRGPQTLGDLVEQLGPGARAAILAEAAAAGDLVVVSIPPRAYLGVPVQPLAGKPVLDTMNYMPQRDGRIPGLYGGSLSSSEVLQRQLGSAHVVKVFNNITSWHLLSLARPAGAADRSALPIAGDNPAAKLALTRFLDAIGYDTVDAGALGAGGRRFQVGSHAWVAAYGALTNERGTPAPVAAIRIALGL